MSRRRNKIERDSCFSHVNLFGLKPPPILRQLLLVKQRPYGTLPGLSTLCVAGTACLRKLIKGGSCNQLRQQKSLSFTTKERVQVKISPRNWWEWGERPYQGHYHCESTSKYKSHDPLLLILFVSRNETFTAVQIAFCFAKTVYWKQYEKKWCRIQLKCNKEWCTMDSLIFFIFPGEHNFLKIWWKKLRQNAF